MNKFIFLIITSLVFSLSVSSCKSTDVVEQKNEVVSNKEPISAPIEKVESEYERATKELKNETVSKEKYEEDKKAILQKISELNVIMKNFDYKSWINYIDYDSITYWSTKSNLSAASKKLPIKGIQLKTLEDYFKFVFVPSRMGRQIDEIRYISSTSIKAVQVRNEDVIIYYNFKKINNDWLVDLPSL